MYNEFENDKNTMNENASQDVPEREANHTAQSQEYTGEARQTEEQPLSEIHRRTHATAVRINTSIEDLVVSAMSQNFVPVVDDRNMFIGIVKRKEIIRYCYQLAFPDRLIDENGISVKDTVSR